MTEKQSRDPRLTDDFDPQASETFTSAHETYADLRKSCPVAHSNEWNGFWALFKYDDIVSVLKDSKTFITSVQNVVPKVAFTGRRPPLHLDPPEHTPYRRALNPFFTNEKMAKLEPALRRITIDLLDPYIRAGGGDICADYTHRLPGYAFAEFFHLTSDLSMKIKEVTTIYDKALQEANDDLVKETSLQLYEIARDIIAERKARPLDPKDDPTTALLAVRHEGKPLPEDMILGTIRQLIVVGMIAPSVLIGTILLHLAKDQALQSRLRRNPDLIPKAVEEFLRLYTPYRGFARTANKDVTIGGRLIKKDEPIALVYASANRDEAVFPNPDEFDLDRPNMKDSVAFGLGPHQCVGAPMGRLEIRLTLEEMLRRTKRFDADGEVKMTRWPEWGTLSVPLKVEPV
ncbi:MAG: cytochrome P450 [Proteobacteria bacterium]|nr:MAG: cytochrome P450 [Pseudomonadota bacterium]